MKTPILFLFLLTAFSIDAQQIKIESDKTADLSKYKTFRFGEGQIVTPKDERVTPDAMVHKWIQGAMTEELNNKGLTKSDSADLIISYLIGSEKRTDAGSVGPLGMTPGSNQQTYLRDYQQGSLVIDLNDAHTNKLVWRVKAVTNANQPDGEKMIDEIIEKGFKKFGQKGKKKK
jgi:hypothetical protein